MNQLIGLLLGFYVSLPFFLISWFLGPHGVSEGETMQTAYSMLLEDTALRLKWEYILANVHHMSVADPAQINIFSEVVYPRYEGIIGNPFGPCSDIENIDLRCCAAMHRALDLCYPNIGMTYVS